ncbi:MAG: helix-turn-helix domain-containing protein [Candidatus Sungbacteria bacterium]|nr:helix-turn-helix domain-containing protein [Candidatus Sungbacteria bacterium]
MKSVNDLHKATFPEKPAEDIALGEYLRMRREAKHISTDEMARELKMAPRYVVALEEGAYHIFPAKIYAHGFFKRSLTFLGVVDEDQQTACMELFQEEWRAHFPEKNEESVPLPTSMQKYSWLLTPMRLMQALGGAALVVFFVFLGIQLMHFTGAPALVLREPADMFVVNSPLVRVTGTTEKESTLTVNGREVTIDGAGHFDVQIDMQPGVNILQFLARSRFGKETRITRAGVVR